MISLIFIVFYSIGTLIYPTINQYITNSDTIVTLKWPNDILINSLKICGILIEIENNRMFIGIGCNIESKPIIDTSGSDSGREATCLAEHNSNIFNESLNSQIIFNEKNEKNENETIKMKNESKSHKTYQKIAIEILNNIKFWIENINFDNSENIINDFTNKMSFLKQKLRNNENINVSTDLLEVVPLKINNDGTLKVKFIHNNEIKDLIADYLY